MTNNGKTILNFLKQHYGEEFTKAQLANELHLPLPSVTGTINGLINRGFIEERAETEEVSPATETRKAIMHTTRYEKLNEAGLAFDPDEDERKKTNK